MRRRFFLLVLACSIIALVAASCSKDKTTAPSGIGMEEAIDIVTNDVIPAEVSQGEKFICLRMSGSIPKGSTIVEDAPGAGQAPALGSPGASFTVDEESYFFYLDLAPQSFYEHQVKYVVVGRTSGDYAVTEANWWPKINDSTPSQFLKSVPDTNFVIAKNFEIVTPIGQEMTFTLPPLFTQIPEGFIVIQGLMPGEALYDDATTTYWNGYNFFDSYKNAYSSVIGLVEDAADDVLTEIDNLVDDGKFIITIYIIAHGGVDKVKLGGIWIYANEFHNKMQEHPGVLFNFLIGSCHSGSFINNLETLDNVRTALAACASDEGAKSDWDERDGTNDYNSSDSGSEWTSSLLTAMGMLTYDTGLWSVILSNASTHGVPVTSELIGAAGYGCLGVNPGFGMTQDLDLSHRTGYTMPAGYRSWEFPMKPAFKP